jgi:hypothetical protein
MKKIIVCLVMLMVSVLSINAQVVISNNTNHARLDMDGDGVWDQEVSVQGIPGISYMRTGRNFYSELGRIYVINQWRQYERMGVNPASYGLPNPENNTDFSAYAGYYARYIGGGMMGGGMVAPTGVYGVPGNASVTVGGKNFGVSVSVPVRNRNNVGTMYTPNASVGVNINGNYVGASIPVSVVTGGKKKAQQTRTVAPVQRTAQPQTTTVTRSNNVNTVPTRVVEMSVDEVAQMLNSGSYM